MFQVDFDLPRNGENQMGILTLQQAGKYIVSSDRSITDSPVRRAPKARTSGDYQVWTGDSWSLVKTDAATFGTLDQADEYVKVNDRRLSGN